MIRLVLRRCLLNTLARAHTQTHMPAPPRPPPADVVLRLSPERASTREISFSQSFSRMSQGRTSVAEYRSEARSFLERFSPDYDGGADTIGVADVTYDPSDPWSSPRGKPRPSSPQFPARNFKPGLSALAARVRQREVFIGVPYGKGKKSLLGLDAGSRDGHEGFFFELPGPASQQPGRVEQMVEVARRAAPEYLPHPRRKKNLRAAKLPQLNPTPRLAKKLALLREGDDELKERPKRQSPSPTAQQK